MSLKAIHLVFITASVMLALGFGAWSVREYSARHASVDLVYAIGSFVVAVALIIYGRYFLKKLKNTSYL